MKLPALVCLALVSGTFLFAADPASPPSGMKFSMVDPSDPSVAKVRRSGEYWIQYVANKFILEVNKELATKSPEDAIDDMHLKSLELPEPAPGTPIVTHIKLTSLKVRNPADAPDQADMDVLDSIRRDLDYGRDLPKLVIQRIDTGSGSPDEWRFYKPIATPDNCLVCHGDSDTVPDAVAEKLHRLYPNDQATGYESHQWRGVIRISLSTAPAAKP